jgi:hypothetical protein
MNDPTRDGQRGMPRRKRAAAAPSNGLDAASASARRVPAVWDYLAFALSLVLAVGLEWSTADLVWSLWLSSLVLGWVGLVVGIARAKTTGEVDTTTEWMMKLFFVGFFTVHFGGFHFVHSVFLAAMFPVTTHDGMPSLELPYAQVFSAYWPWLLVAAVAERRFLSGDMGVPRDARTAGSGAKQRKLLYAGFDPLAAYKNVIRMHLLIFALVPLQLAGVGDAWGYVLVYSVYFWPRRAAQSVASAA